MAQEDTAGLEWPRSEGTLGVYGRYEYFTDGRVIYRSLFRNPLEATGYRSGMRLFCTIREWPINEAELAERYYRPPGTP